MPQITTTLVKDKETPGTVRFTETEPVVGERPLSFYLPNEVAEHVGVAIDSEDAAIQVSIAAA